MFTKACDLNESKEGKTDVAAVERTLVLLVWPQGGKPMAYQGMCPHANEPLMDAFFDGKVISCRHHEWEFDATSGACIRGKPCKLAEYPLQISDGEILVDVSGVTPNRA